MIAEEQVVQITKEYLENTDSYLVDVRVNAGNIIVVEIDNNAGVSIDECAALSRYIEEKLDREIEDFELEVGSAGLTSPFKVKRQYEKNIGNEIEILTGDGRKLYGRLSKVEEETFSVIVIKKIKPEGAKRKVEIEETEVFRYDEVKQVKYLLKV